jgi:uncharacterized protein YjbJ (UPF0337 family)
VDLSSIQGQVDQLLRSTANPTQNAAQDTEFKALISRALQNPGGVNPIDHEALVNAVMSRTGKSHPDSGQIVNGFQQTYQQAQAKVQQMTEQAKVQAQQAADATRKAAAKGALAATLALVLGALAAAFGGRSGTPRDLIGATTPPRA